MIELDGKVVPPSFKEHFKMLLNRLAAKLLNATKPALSSGRIERQFPWPVAPGEKIMAGSLVSLTRAPT